MKLGLLTDVHEDVENLRAALEIFRREAVDRIVFLGDICEAGQRLPETCELFSQVDFVGVIGNHDYGLWERSREGDVSITHETVRAVAAKLEPSIELEDCYFAHVEPWLDPRRIEDLWYYQGIPDTPDKQARIFSVGAWKCAFAGHYHRWMWVNEQGMQTWQGDTPISLNAGRHFVVIETCMKQACATYDTATRILQPLQW